MTAEFCMCVCVCVCEWEKREMKIKNYELPNSHVNITQIIF